MADRLRIERLRPWLRALHRDIGYSLVGLTLVYAVSGLAVNHIADWDPNFHDAERTHHLALPLPTEDSQLASAVLRQLHLTATDPEVTRVDDHQVEIIVGRTTLQVDPTRGEVLERTHEPRALLRVANWLHLNRGKPAWKRFADAYALLLIFLALSGIFMLPGRRGLLGRGAVFVALGVAVPVVYVVWSGGP